MCLPFLNCITNKNKDSNRVSLSFTGHKGTNYFDSPTRNRQINLYFYYFLLNSYYMIHPIRRYSSRSRQTSGPAAAAQQRISFCHTIPLKPDHIKYKNAINKKASSAEKSPTNEAQLSIIHCQLPIALLY